MLFHDRQEAGKRLAAVRELRPRKLVAAAALLAASREPPRLRAVVSRGGRPDLTKAENLARVRVPTLLIAGEQDPAIIEVSLEALRRLSGERRLAIVPGATHLFEEAGAIAAVSRLASEWFVRNLQRQVDTRAPPQGKAPPGQSAGLSTRTP